MATISFAMSVRLPAHISAPTGRMLIKFSYLKILRKSFDKIQVSLKSDNNNNNKRRTAPQGSPRTPATCIAATTPGLIVRF